MNTKRYTVITFAPVQGFIEKSRKLRDLYGSSYILSLLSWVVCQAVYKLNCSVVSPALPNVTQGMPNQIIVEGEISKADIEQIEYFFNKAWAIIADSCQTWIEDNVKDWQYYWQRDWQLWKKHAWEFFAAIGETGESITDVRQHLNQVKNERDWTGINWQGESSTLSGADGIAYPYLGRIADPREYNYREERINAQSFYQELSQKLGESFIKININKLSIPEAERSKRSIEYGYSFIDPREELSIPELVKRLITHQAIVEIAIIRLRNKLNLEVPEEQFREIAKDLKPDSFSELSRQKDPKDTSEIAENPQPDSSDELSSQKDKSEEKKYWTAWFLGDGDGAGKYFQSLPPETEAEEMTKFSQEMREWGSLLKKEQRKYLQKKGRMIYAGGDDFLGVLYKHNRKFSALECLELFYTFKSGIWQKPEQKEISVSVGFVWAAPGVPQRDVLQHCHAAEGSAKSTGRDRIAFRILFNSGNHLEWVSPWWLLDNSDRQDLAKKNADRQDLANKNKPLFPEPSEKLANLIESYQDRNNGNNWTHFYQDVATLESRHAFSDKSIDIALGLIEIYFDSTWRDLIGNTDNWWNHYNKHEIQIFTGILGDPKRFNPEYQETPESRKKLNNDPKVKEAFNNWVINLAKVGFHLTDNHGNSNSN
jgi:CRISPR-associated protein Cmr2